MTDKAQKKPENTQNSSSEKLILKNEKADSNFGRIVIIMIIVSLGIMALWRFFGSPGSGEQEISGKVVNRYNNPIEGVAVSFLEQLKFTDIDGRFSFICPSRDSFANVYIKHPKASYMITRKVILDGSSAADFIIVFDDSSSRISGVPGSISGKNTAANFPFDLKNSKTLNSGYSVWIDLSWEDFIRKNQELVKSDFHLTDIEIYPLYNPGKIAAVWYADNQPHRFWKADNLRSLLAQDQNFSGSGFYLTDLEVFIEQGKRKFLGIWRSGAQAQHRFWVDLDWDAFLEKRKQLARENYQLVDIEVYPYQQGSKYAGIWKKVNRKSRLWKASSRNDFLLQRKRYQEEGLHLKELEIFYENGQKKYIGIWQPGNTREKLWLEATWKDFQNKRQEFDRSNFRLIDLEVDISGRAKRFSGIWIF